MYLCSVVSPAMRSSHPQSLSALPAPRDRYVSLSLIRSVPFVHSPIRARAARHTTHTTHTHNKPGLAIPYPAISPPPLAPSATSLPSSLSSLEFGLAGMLTSRHLNIDNRSYSRARGTRANRGRHSPARSACPCQGCHLRIQICLRSANHSPLRLIRYQGPTIQICESSVSFVAIRRAAVR